MALDDNAIQCQKYTSIGRFQLFLKVFVPLAFTRSPNPASWDLCVPKTLSGLIE